MINEELLKAVMNKIVEVDKRGWSQEAYASRTPCGTQHCVAGWAMVLSGYTVDEESFFFRPDGTLVREEDDEAQELLGLDDDQADEIFFWGLGGGGSVKEMLAQITKVTGMIN